jgi:SAM-dependent methyltransferase
LKRHFLYGIEAPELGWVPMPRYLLRRARVLHHLGRGNGRKVLDIGCGAGALLNDLSARGFDCTGLETSPKAREVARSINCSYPMTTICEEPEHDWGNKFDFVMSFEVLEHIQDDQAALAQWREWLKPGGVFITSVPCHMNKWSQSDEWAGHVRRYEEDQIRKLLSCNGLDVISFETYGYPFLSAIDALRKRHYSRARQERPHTGPHGPSQNTAESGVDRHELRGFYKLCKTPPGLAMILGAIQLQKAFLRSGRGDGFLIVARSNR